MFKEIYRDHVINLRQNQIYRELPKLIHDSNSYLNFAGNDYLGLSTNPLLIQAAKDAAVKYGIGSTGSRLLSGNSEIFHSLEKKIAADKNTESALILNSGFQANISVISCLLNKKILKNQAIVFCDRLNHASIYQGIFLSGAELVRYGHNDMQQLTDLIKKYENDIRPKFLITETIFGMDGDILHIQDIVNIAKKNNIFLYLDEAHATGVIGKKGYGLSTLIDLSEISYIIMGTFSKALGVSGAYIACNEYLKEFIVNSCSGFIYSTANSPAVIGAASTAWDFIKDLTVERRRLFDLSNYLRSRLNSAGFNTGTSQTNIVPIILGKEEIALRAFNYLLEQKIILSCIRPPSVPPGSARLRIALNVKHTEGDVDRLINAVKFI